jgi:hypothetical protein
MDLPKLYGHNHPADQSCFFPNCDFLESETENMVEHLVHIHGKKHSHLLSIRSKFTIRDLEIIGEKRLHIWAVMESELYRPYLIYSMVMYRSDLSRKKMMFLLTHLNRLNLLPGLKNCFTGLLLWKPKPEPIPLSLTLKTLILMLLPAP